MAFFPIRIDAAGGEYMDAVVITDWRKAPGDAVAKGELLLTVETAKAATEIEAEYDGWLAEIRFAEGAEAPVGAILGQITDIEGETPATSNASNAPQTTPQISAPGQIQKTARVVASPLARRIAAQKGVSLDTVTGTGPRGRIKARDVEKATMKYTPRPDEATHHVPLLLLHGFGADRTSWNRVRALMPGGIETVPLDLPGHGQRTAHPAMSLDEMVADITDQLSDLALEEFHLAGHSLGAATALALTTAARHVVRSLSLIAPPGLGHTVNPNFLDGITRSDTPEELMVWLRQMVVDPACLPRGLPEVMIAQLARNGSRQTLQTIALALLPGGNPAFDLSGALPVLDIPVRLIWGGADRIIPASHAVRVPGPVALHMLPDTGHVPQIENPALVSRLLVETVRSAG